MSKRLWACSLLLIALACPAASAQEPEQAADRVKRLQGERDIDALAAYTLQIIDAYHTLKATTQQQSSLVDILSADRQQLIDAMASIQQEQAKQRAEYVALQASITAGQQSFLAALDKERVSRETITASLADTDKFDNKAKIRAVADGMAISATVTRNPYWTLGSGLTSFLLQAILHKKH